MAKGRKFASKYKKEVTSKKENMKVYGCNSVEVEINFQILKKLI